MRTLWRGIVRTIFWSYDRGTWPYDLMVVVIVVFVLLTPRSWFHDQPQRSFTGQADHSPHAGAGTRSARYWGGRSSI